MTQSPFIKCGENLTLIPLPQDLPGFDTFINAWLITGDRNYLVDPGPTVTIPTLRTVLGTLGIHHLDAILLTHIHIDHSGGIGDLSPHFPDTPVVCHSKAVEHLVDPARLWAGSVKTLGDTARAYGPIAPVPDNRVVSVEALAERDIDIILTPGHAVHHVSYLVNDTLFAGEAGGVYREFPGGFYLRPATPPKFFLETSIESIAALEQVNCRQLCYGHFGLTPHPAKLLKAHRRQLQGWADAIANLTRDTDTPAPVQRCLEILIKKDPLLSRWPEFSNPEQQRELSFMANSVRGFLGYLQNSQS
ncbi:MAG: MBL fold metallo-hydrolase [Desulfobacterales bacterium]|nr:MBL fold metallo-hydrolase [Desulfobacterales bacterium]